MNRHSGQFSLGLHSSDITRITTVTSNTSTHSDLHKSGARTKDIDTGHIHDKTPHDKRKLRSFDNDKFGVKTSVPGNSFGRGCTAHSTQQHPTTRSAPEKRKDVNICDLQELSNKIDNIDKTQFSLANVLTSIHMNIVDMINSIAHNNEMLVRLDKRIDELAIGVTTADSVTTSNFMNIGQRNALDDKLVTPVDTINNISLGQIDNNPTTPVVSLSRINIHNEPCGSKRAWPEKEEAAEKRAREQVFRHPQNINTPSCIFCNAARKSIITPHYSNACRKVKSARLRYITLFTQRRCMRCCIRIDPGHNSDKNHKPDKCKNMICKYCYGLAGACGGSLCTRSFVEWDMRQDEVVPVQLYK